jgi:hypothetical protein
MLITNNLQFIKGLSKMLISKRRHFGDNILITNNLQFIKRLSRNLAVKTLALDGISQNKLRAPRFAGYRIHNMEERRCVGNEPSPSGDGCF